MLQIVSKYRSEVMGVAGIIIVIHHYLTSYLGEPYRFGAVGVDMFMFTMGLGLFFSLTKSAENRTFLKSLPYYFWRRFIRIIPTLAVFLLTWSLWKYSNGGFEVKDFLLNLSLTGYWTLKYGKYFNWFVSGLLIFYLVAPIMFLAINKQRNKLLPTLIMFALLSLIVFNLKQTSEGKIYRSLIMIARLIPMCFGMLFGAYCDKLPEKKEKTFTQIFFIFLFIVGVIFYIVGEVFFDDPNGFKFGYRWYSFGLIAPMMCVFISYIVSLASRLIDSASKILSFFGKISFELYLVHIFIIEYILPQLQKNNVKPWFSEPINFIFSFVISTLYAYLLSLLSKRINHRDSIKSK